MGPASQKIFSSISPFRLTVPNSRVVNVEVSEYDVYIGRYGEFGQRNILNTEPGRRGWLGNPYKLTLDGGEITSREEMVELFALDFRERLDSPGFQEHVEALRGKRLGCYCAPELCHGDVILQYLEEPNQLNGKVRRLIEEAKTPNP